LGKYPRFQKIFWAICPENLKAGQDQTLNPKSYIFIIISVAN
jgi:hypothetical protein